MFRSRVTLEEYLKSIEHKAAAGEDASLDDIDMFPNLEEEDLATMEEDTCDSRVSMNINSSLITIPDDFKDDREVLIIDDKGNARKVGGRINVNMAYKLVPPEKIMVPLNTLLQPIKKAGSLFNGFLADVAKRPSLCPLNYEDWRLVPQYFRARIIMFVRKWSTNGKQARGKQLHAHTSGSQSFAIKRDIFEKEHQREPGPLEWFMKTHQDKDGSYHEPATKKFVDIAVDIVKKKTGAPEVVFSEATVPAETFAYRKLMGPESSGRVRGVGSGVTSNQLHAKHSGQSGTESLGIVSLLLKEVQSLRQEVAYLKAQRSDNAQSLSQGDDVEDNQRPLPPSDTECIRHRLTPTTTLTMNHGIHTKDVVTSDKSGVVHASRSPNIVNKASQQRSSHITSVGGKENIQV